MNAIGKVQSTTHPRDTRAPHPGTTSGLRASDCCLITLHNHDICLQLVLIIRQGKRLWLETLADSDVGD